jgi:hypothetical protein
MVGGRDKSRPGAEPTAPRRGDGGDQRFLTLGRVLLPLPPIVRRRHLRLQVLNLLGHESDSGTWKKWRPDLWMSAFMARADINQLGDEGLLSADIVL